MSSDPSSCSSCGSPLEASICPGCILGALAKKDQESVEALDGGPSIPGLTVHEEVGEGGFGIVYRATQVGVVKRRVALKVLKPGVDTRAVLRRFAVEQQALALLEHPYIARFYEAGETLDGYPWFTMEYIEGESITEALAACDWESVLEVFLNVCGAVSFAHEKGILHRDLKPSNLLVTPEGVPKVIDFGVAKATDAEESTGMTLYTMDEIQVGTPAYSAPEKGAEVDVRSEVYSLGATLFELLTGVCPPDREGPLPKPSSLAIRKLPGGLDIIVQRAMEIDPDERYQSVRDFAVDLRKVLQGETIKGYATKQFWWKLAIPLFSFTLVILAVIFWPRIPPADDSSLSYDLIRHSASGSPNRIQINRDGTRALAVFRDGGGNVLFDPRDGRKLFTYPAPPFGIGSGKFDEDGKRFLIGFSNGTVRRYSSEDGEILSPYLDCTPGKTSWIPDLDTFTIMGESEPTMFTVNTDSYFRAWTESGELRWEIPLVTEPYSFVVSPDRGKAIIGSRTGDLNFIDLPSATKTILEGHRDMTYRIVYSPSGKYFACACFDGRASIWHQDGRQFQVFRHQGKVEQVAFSPDGKYLASASWDHSARLWDVESGEEVHRLEHLDSVRTLAFSPDGKILATGGQDTVIRFWNVETGEAFNDSIDCQGSVGELEFIEREDGGFNLIALTKESALRVFKFSDWIGGE